MANYNKIVIIFVRLNIKMWNFYCTFVKIFEINERMRMKRPLFGKLYYLLENFIDQLFCENWISRIYKFLCLEFWWFFMHAFWLNFPFFILIKVKMNTCIPKPVRDIVWKHFQFQPQSKYPHSVKPYCAVSRDILQHNNAPAKSVDCSSNSSY